MGDSPTTTCLGNNRLVGSSSPPSPTTQSYVNRDFVLPPFHRVTKDVNVRHSRGHDRHAGHSVAMFRDNFWLSLALTIPVVFWSTDVQHWLGYTAKTDSITGLVTGTTGLWRRIGPAPIRQASSRRARLCRRWVTPIT
jgi:hypothetical protein